jgi:hypothetical protein
MADRKSRMNIDTDMNTLGHDNDGTTTSNDAGEQVSFYCQ